MTQVLIVIQTQILELNQYGRRKWVLRVDTSNDQGSFKFSSIPGDAHSVGTTPASFYGEVAYSGNAAFGVTDAFLDSINDQANPGLNSDGSLAKDSPVHVGAVAGATAVLSLGQTASGKVDLNFNSANAMAPKLFKFTSKLLLTAVPVIL